MTKILMKGNEALAEAAIRAGMTRYFFYPITPQTEISEYIARHFPECLLQAESETAAISMVFGAAAVGARTMTSSSGPGISLKQEGISYLSGAELPCVIVNMMRTGPALGGIQPAQGDYFQAVRGGGHGDYQIIVLAPSSVQEIADLTGLAFELADQYRNPVMILGDGLLGQMMEPLEFPQVPTKKRQLPQKSWAVGVRRTRKTNSIIPFGMDSVEWEEFNIKLQRKFALIQEMEVRYELLLPDEWSIFKPDSELDIVLVAYGSIARILKTVKRDLEKEGIRVGLFRPVTLWPFPSKILRTLTKCTNDFLVVEMSAGQMVEDVRLSIEGRAEVHFYGRMGGVVPGPQEIADEIRKILANRKES